MEEEADIMKVQGSLIKMTTTTKLKFPDGPGSIMIGIDGGQLPNLPNLPPGYKWVAIEAPSDSDSLAVVAVSGDYDLL